MASASYQSDSKLSRLEHLLFLHTLMFTNVEHQIQYISYPEQLVRIFDKWLLKTK